MSPPLMAQQTIVGQGILIIEASRSHWHTPHSVRLLRTSDHPDAGTSTWQHTTLTRERHPCTRRDSNPKRKLTQTYALNGAATGIGWRNYTDPYLCSGVKRIEFHFVYPTYRHCNWFLGFLDLSRQISVQFFESGHGCLLPARYKPMINLIWRRNWNGADNDQTTDERTKEYQKESDILPALRRHENDSAWTLNTVCTKTLPQAINWKKNFEATY